MLYAAAQIKPQPDLDIVPSEDINWGAPRRETNFSGCDRIQQHAR